MLSLSYVASFNLRAMNSIFESVDMLRTRVPWFTEVVSSSQSCMHVYGVSP